MADANKFNLYGLWMGTIEGECWVEGADVTGLIEPGGELRRPQWTGPRNHMWVVHSWQGMRGLWMPVNAGGWGLKCA